MKKILAVILCLVLMAGVCCADSLTNYIEPTYSTIMSDQSMYTLMQSKTTRAVCAMCMLMDTSLNGALPESLFNTTNSFYIGYSGNLITMCLDSDEGLFFILYDTSTGLMAYTNFGALYSGLGKSVMEGQNTACYTVSASDLASAIEILEN